MVDWLNRLIVIAPSEYSMIHMYWNHIRILKLQTSCKRFKWSHKVLAMSCLTSSSPTFSDRGTTWFRSWHQSINYIPYHNACNIIAYSIDITWENPWLWRESENWQKNRKRISISCTHVSHRLPLNLRNKCFKRWFYILLSPLNPHWLCAFNQYFLGGSTRTYTCIWKSSNSLLSLVSHCTRLGVLVSAP